MENNNQEFAPVITIKNWVLYIIVSSIPLVGFIMLLVWAFSGDSSTNPNRRNWAKAYLIIQLAAFVLVFLLYFFIAMAGMALYNQ